MPYNMILYLRLPYPHVYNSALFPTYYFSSYRRSLDTFYSTYNVYGQDRFLLRKYSTHGSHFLYLVVLAVDFTRCLHGCFNCTEIVKKCVGATVSVRTQGKNITCMRFVLIFVHSKSNHNRVMRLLRRLSLLQYSQNPPLLHLLTNLHYNDAIMGAMASWITSRMIVYKTVYSGADQRKHQRSAPHGDR